MAAMTGATVSGLGLRVDFCLLESALLHPSTVTPKNNPNIPKNLIAFLKGF